MKYLRKFESIVGAPSGYKHKPKLATLSKEDIKDILVNFSDWDNCDIKIDELHNSSWKDYVRSGYEFRFDINISPSIKYGEDLGDTNPIILNDDLLDDLVRLYFIFKEDKWDCDITLTLKGRIGEYKEKVYDVPTSGYFISEDGIYFQYEKIGSDKMPPIMNIELTFRSW
jgi:hypothetical protein